MWKTLGDGTKMPAMSLGTCCGSKPSVGVGPWVAAGGIGIDTSIDYEGGKGEADIATALAAAKVKREDVYITTKITAGCGKTQCYQPSVEAAIDSVKTSLKNLNTTYIDMILLHRPCEQTGQNCSIDAGLSNCSGPVTVKNFTAANNLLWKGLQQAKKMGLVKSIGVSNYFAGQLAALEGEKPAINQCEMSIEGHDDDTISYCQANNITYESYGAMRGCPFTHPTVEAIAKAHSASAAQVCLRWALQRGAVLASGTGSNASKAAAYSKENLGAITMSELTGDEMTKLGNLQLMDTPTLLF